MNNIELQFRPTEDNVANILDQLERANLTLSACPYDSEEDYDLFVDLYWHYRLFEMRGEVILTEQAKLAQYQSELEAAIEVYESAKDDYYNTDDWLSKIIFGKKLADATVKRDDLQYRVDFWRDEVVAVISATRSNDLTNFVDTWNRFQPRYLVGLNEQEEVRVLQAFENIRKHFYSLSSLRHQYLFAVEEFKQIPDDGKLITVLTKILNSTYVFVNAVDYYREESNSYFLEYQYSGSFLPWLISFFYMCVSLTFYGIKVVYLSIVSLPSPYVAFSYNRIMEANAKIEYYDSKITEEETKLVI